MSLLQLVKYRPIYLLRNETFDSTKTHAACGRACRPSWTTSQDCSLHSNLVMSPHQSSWMTSLIGLEHRTKGLKGMWHLPSSVQVLCLSSDIVRRILSRVNPHKAAGPDNVHSHTYAQRMCRPIGWCPKRHFQHISEPVHCPKVLQIYHHNSTAEDVISAWMTTNSLHSHWP